MSDRKSGVLAFLAGGISAVLAGACIFAIVLLNGSPTYRGTISASPDKRFEVRIMGGGGRNEGRGLVQVFLSSQPDPILVISNREDPKGPSTGLRTQGWRGPQMEGHSS